MKKKVLLSSLLITGVMGAAGFNLANAADNASQTVTATLGTCQKVETDGGNLSTTIDCDTGTLSAALTPAFKVTTNTGTSQDMFLNAATITSGGPENALGLQGGTMYFALANTATGFVPSDTDVQDALSASPTLTSNPNVVAFATTLAASPSVGVTITPSSDFFDIDLAQQGETVFTSTTSGTARTGTYDFNDTPGDYVSAIELSFGTP